eukprot:scaffold329020_cov20-Prasinocladus_malaysianus.AAC.1
MKRPHASYLKLETRASRLRSPARPYPPKQGQVHQSCHARCVSEFTTRLGHGRSEVAVMTRKQHRLFQRGDGLADIPEPLIGTQALAGSLIARSCEHLLPSYSGYEECIHHSIGR